MKTRECLECGTEFRARCNKVCCSKECQKIRTKRIQYEYSQRPETKEKGRLRYLRKKGEAENEEQPTARPYYDPHRRLAADLLKPLAEQAKAGDDQAKRWLRSPSVAVQASIDVLDVAGEITQLTQ